MKRFGRRQQFILAIVFFFAGIVSLSAYHYYEQISWLRSAIDTKLRTAAYAIEGMLGEKFHSGLTAESVSDAKDYEISMTLTEFVNSAELAYVYTLIRDGEQIRFITSSADPLELAENRYKPAFWSLYQEADQAIFDAFASGETQLSEYEDRWGRFRSIFIPMTASDGTIYIVGADVSIDVIHAQALTSALAALGNGLLHTALAIPLVLLIMAMLNDTWKVRWRTTYFDNMTGLANRKALSRDLKRMRHPHLILFSVDNLYDITNIYGLSVGDSVIAQFAYNLQNYRHPHLNHHKAYRIHDEVLAVAADQKFDNGEEQDIFRDVYRFATRCRYRMPDQKNISLNLHVGVVYNVEDPLTLAHMALRHAKKTNLSVVLYDDEKHLPVSYRHELEQIEMIKRAFEEDRIVPYFHAIVDSRTMTIKKYEVLARIVDNTGKVLMYPEEFIPLMQRVRLYQRFSQRILDKTIAKLRETNLSFSVNFSTHDVIDPDHTKKFLRKIADNPDISHRLQFELLESDSVANHDKLIFFVRKLQRLGCQVGLDDLGKEYSNFDRLTTLPIDFVKIDRSVIEQIGEQKSAMKLAVRIIELAKDHDIRTVAEYCCDHNTSRQVAELGVDYLQGFWFGEPAPEPSETPLNLLAQEKENGVEPISY